MRDSELLFVYGTLRPSVARGGVRRLIEGLDLAGPATVRGVLYDLGEYPGLVPANGLDSELQPQLVHGDLLRIVDADRLAAIDEFEGCGGPNPLYHRITSLVSRPDGSTVDAWLYCYARSIRGFRPIPGGDYTSRPLDVEGTKGG